MNSPAAVLQCCRAPDQYTLDLVRCGSIFSSKTTVKVIWIGVLVPCSGVRFDLVTWFCGFIANPSSLTTRGDYCVLNHSLACLTQKTIQLLVSGPAVFWTKPSLFSRKSILTTNTIILERFPGSLPDTMTVHCRPAPLLLTPNTTDNQRKSLLCLPPAFLLFKIILATTHR